MNKMYPLMLLLGQNNNVEPPIRKLKLYILISCARNNPGVIRSTATTLVAKNVKECFARIVAIIAEDWNL